jgi:hypothetical protein
VTDKPALDDRALAAIDVIKRTGAESFQIRYSDDEQPVVWLAVVTWRINRQGIPTKHGAGRAHEAAAALTPDLAIYRLAEQIVDGGTCAHCGRPAAFNPDLSPTILDEALCWWAWDPETSTYVQACQLEEATRR